MELKTVQDVKELRPVNVTQAYSGRADRTGNHCRCGCCGKYYKHDDAVFGSKTRANSERQIARILTIVQENIEVQYAAAADADKDCLIGGCFADVEVDGRNYAVYVDAR